MPEFVIHPSDQNPPHLLMWGVIVGLIVLVGVGWWWNMRFTFAQAGSGFQTFWQDVQGERQGITEQTQASQAQLSKAFEAVKETVGEAVGQEAKDQLTDKVINDMKQTLERPSQQETASSEESSLEQTTP